MPTHSTNKKKAPSVNWNIKFKQQVDWKGSRAKMKLVSKKKEQHENKMTIFVLFLESMSPTLHPYARTRLYEPKEIRVFPLFLLKEFLEWMWKFSLSLSWFSFLSFFRKGISRLESHTRDRNGARVQGNEEKENYIAMYKLFFYSSFISSYSLCLLVLVDVHKKSATNTHSVKLCYQQTRTVNLIFVDV